MKNFIYSLVLSVLLICFMFCFDFKNKIILLFQNLSAILVVILFMYQLSFLLSAKVNKRLIIGTPGKTRKIYSYSDMTQLQQDVIEQKKQGEFVSLKVEEICDFAKIINIFWCEILYYLQKLRENSNILEAEKFTSLLFGTREYEIRELLLFQLKIKKININDIDADYELETKFRNEIRFIVRNFEDCRNEYFNVRYNKASR